MLAIAAAFTVTGCMTTDAYTGEKKVNNTTKGAGIGALAGAVLGAATGDNSKERRKRALIGAGVGALTGARRRRLHGPPGSQVARAAAGHRRIGHA